MEKVHFVPSAKGGKEDLSHEGGKCGHLRVANLYASFEVIPVSLEIERIPGFGREEDSWCRSINLTVRNTTIYFLERREASLSCRYTLVQYSYSFKHVVFSMN